MSLAELDPSDRSGGGALLLWGAAALAAIAAHAGVAAWVLRNPPVVPAEAAAPAAVMLDLAPAPVSPELAEPEISERNFDAPEIAAPQPDAMTTPSVTTPADMPVPPTPPGALATPVTDAAPQIEMPPVVPEAEVAVSRPVARPKDLRRADPAERAPQPQRATRQPAREPSRDPPAQAARRASAAAPPAETAAAAQTSRGSSGAVTPAQWQSRLMAHLERRKRYPPSSRARREEGVAHVRFAIDAKGNVTSVRLARSSGHVALDEEVVALVRRSSPVPAPPPGAPLDITAPFQFRIR